MVKKLAFAIIATAVIGTNAFAAAGDNPTRMTSKGYVDSGLIRKADRTELAAVETIAETAANTADAAAGAVDALAETVATIDTDLGVAEGRLDAIETAGYLTNADMTDYALDTDLTALENVVNDEETGLAATNAIANTAAQAAAAAIDATELATELSAYTATADLGNMAFEDTVSEAMLDEDLAQKIANAVNACAEGNVLVGNTCVPIESGSYSEASDGI